MQDYPAINLGTLETIKWDDFRKFAESKGTPYIDREIQVVIDLRSRQWIGAICTFYKKGVYQLDFHVIRNPFTKEKNLKPLKPKRYDWGLEKARDLVKEFKEENERHK